MDVRQWFCLLTELTRRAGTHTRAPFTKLKSQTLQFTRSTTIRRGRAEVWDRGGLCLDVAVLSSAYRSHGRAAVAVAAVQVRATTGALAAICTISPTRPAVDSIALIV